jgi:hypothetical protein
MEYPAGRLSLPATNTTITALPEPRPGQSTALHERRRLVHLAGTAADLDEPGGRGRDDEPAQDVADLDAVDALSASVSGR